MNKKYIRKKRMFIFLIILMTGMIIVCDKSNAAVGDTTTGGVTGGYVGCTSNYCYNAAVGFRVTLFYAGNSGSNSYKRCKYDPATQTICGDTGTALGSYDFWMTRDSNVSGGMGLLSSNVCQTYKGHMTKQEFLSIDESRRNNYLTSCSNERQAEFGIADLGFNVGSLGLEKGNLSSWASNPINFDKISANLVEKIKNGDYQILDRILNIMVNGQDVSGSRKVNHNNLATNDIHVQFDELVIYGGRSGGNTSYAAKGTVAEVLWYYHKLNRQTWCVSNTVSTQNALHGPTIWCTDEIVRDGYVTGWYGKANSKVDVKKLGLTDGNASSAGSTSENNNWQGFWKKNTRNVSHLYLGDLLDPCTTKLRTILTSGNETQYEKLKRDYPEATNYFIRNYSFNEAKFFYKNNSSLNTKIACAAKLDCADKAKAIYNKCGTEGSCKIDGVHNLSYEQALIDYARSDKSSTDKITNYSSNQWNKVNINAQKRVNSSYLPTSCGAVSCNTANVVSIMNTFSNANDETYNNFIEWLYNATGQSFPLLLTDTWQALGESGPSCTTPPPCDVPPDDDLKYSCSSDSLSVKLEDYLFGENTDEAQKCWQSGYSYTNGGIQSSLAKSYQAKGCNVYCSEKVEFVLPDASNNSQIRAGQIFKWGITSDKKDATFGTMKVTRTCKIKPNRTGTCKDVNVTYGYDEWKDDVQTNIRLNYEEPTNSTLNRSGNLSAPQFVSGTGQYNVTCANKNCTNVGLFTTSADYKINYSDSSSNNQFKWYSYKVDSSLTNRTQDVIDNPIYYYEIGYGLPTAFTTPTGNYGEGASKGKLEALIRNIGVKNHFNKLVKSVTGTENVTYSCSFNIKNEIFGHECEYDEEGNLISGSPEYCDPEESPKNIDVVFRTIDLINVNGDLNSEIDYAFPGRAGIIDGNSRRIGYNWWENLDSYGDDEASKKETIAEILDNRVYEKDEPQYEIRLDSSLIDRIRDYNQQARTNGVDGYSELEILTDDKPGYTGYACVERDGAKYCASRFLSRLIEIGELEGTCANNMDTKSRADIHLANGC